ncbi:MAG: helix-turn-helix transcriptional regulator [Clostridia bacterium]|nr:helix-turn-helix transcriptional regulator [Clostridia bacterium]
MSTFSERIKDMRYQKQLSQQKMAEILGIDVRLYQYYESDKKCPSLINALKIAIALDVSLDFLCGRTEMQEVNTKP